MKARAQYYKLLGKSKCKKRWYDEWIEALMDR